MIFLFHRWDMCYIPGPGGYPNVTNFIGDMYSESLIFRHPIVESFFGMFLQQDLSVCHFFHISKGSTVTPQWQSPISGRVDTWDPFFFVDLLRCFRSFHRKSTTKMTIIINYSFLRSPKSSTLCHSNGKKHIL